MVWGPGPAKFTMGLGLGMSDSCLVLYGMMYETESDWSDFVGLDVS
jgi:hypothetical protein